MPSLCFRKSGGGRRRRIYSKYSDHEPSSSRVKTLAAQGTPPQAKTSTSSRLAAAAAQNKIKMIVVVHCGHKTRATRILMDAYTSWILHSLW
jgi:hypothetical protein